jgi:hypothetical protein
MNAQLASLEEAGLREVPFRRPSAAVRAMKGILGLVVLASIVGAVVSGFMQWHEYLGIAVAACAVSAVGLVLANRVRVRHCPECRRAMESRKIDVCAQERSWHEKLGLIEGFGPDVTYVRGGSGCPDQRVFRIAYVCGRCRLYEIEEQHREETAPHEKAARGVPSRRRRKARRSRRPGKRP